jgi:hypothetical protein
MLPVFDGAEAPIISGDAVGEVTSFTSGSVIRHKKQTNKAQR